MAPKVARRPAAEPRLRGVLRRPALAEEERRGDSPAAPLELGIGSMAHGVRASYYNNPCQFTGKITEEDKDVSGRYLMIKLTGTNSESLLTWASGSHQLARVHMCHEECSQDTVRPGLFHCQEARAIGGLHEVADLVWRDVLVSAADRGGDELAGLRGRMKGLPDPAPGGVRPVEIDDPKLKGTTKGKDKQKKET